GGGDGRVMPPELVGEVMGYCGTPILRLDGLSEEVATLMHPLDLEYAFIDNGEVYHVEGRNSSIALLRSHTRALKYIYSPKNHMTHIKLYGCCYDAEHRRLFIFYAYDNGPSVRYALVGYSFSEERIFLDMDLDTFSNKSGIYSLSAAGDFVYMAFTRRFAVDVYYIRWAKSKEAKLAYSFGTVHSPERLSVLALPTSPPSVNVLYQYMPYMPMEEPGLSSCVFSYHQLRLQMVRSQPFIKFKAVKIMRVESERGFLVPIIGSHPPLYVSHFKVGNEVHLHSADNLRELAELYLAEAKLENGRMIVDGRWTLGYLRRLDSKYNGSGYHHLVRVHPYVDE
ncbi:hypothetical protein FOZ63_005904, partial [Perkinsus olseni]